MNGIGEQYGLSRMEIDVLLFLYNNPGHDTASDLVELRSIARPYVSMAVESLTRKHCLNQLPDSSDRRIVHLQIRPEAMDAVRDTRKRQDTFLPLLFSGVPEDDRQAMDRVFSTLSLNLKKLPDTKQGGGNRADTVFRRPIILKGNHSEMFQKNFKAHEDQDDSSRQLRL